jgi:hypothetical protein
LIFTRQGSNCGNVIREARLGGLGELPSASIEYRHRGDHAKTDLHIALKSVEKAEHSRVTTLIFDIKARTVSNGDSKRKRTG